MAGRERETNPIVRSEAKTVAKYLDELPADRRAVVTAMRKLVLENLPKGYVEAMSWGMISYEIPLERYPETYNGRPLGYVAIAAQKNHYAFYLMSVYADSKEEKALRAAFAKAGKKLDIGKCCLRFRQLENVELTAIGRVIAAKTPEQYIAYYEKSRKKP